MTFYIADVQIRGLKPLLIHSAQELLRPKKKNEPKIQDLSPEEQAERAVYRDKEGYLMVPAQNVMGLLINASKTFQKQRGKMGMVQVIKGAITISPDEIRILDSKLKPLKEYVVDARLTVNPTTHGRVPTYRPKVENWTMRFNLKWNTLLYPLMPFDSQSGSIGLKSVLDASQYIGLCDYRPVFGIFKIEKFDVKEEKGEE